MVAATYTVALGGKCAQYEVHLCLESALIVVAVHVFKRQCHVELLADFVRNVCSLGHFSALLRAGAGVIPVKV